MNKLKAIIAIFAIFLFVGCAERKVVIENRAIVSIAPLKPLVEKILGEDFEVSVLVPQGASPETFEPTPKQLREVETARFVFGTGLLEFEQSLLHRIARNEQIINLSHGIELLAGTCSHAHHAHTTTCEHGHHHAHGIDPHIWCSPKALGKMAENTYNAIAREMPDSTKYGERYTALCIKLLELDEEVTELCRQSPHSTFFIYHPALTYLARDYSLTQVAVEHEGKEPSAKHLSRIIEQARAEGVKYIFYQSEFPASSVEVICNDIGATAVEINPLEEDIFENIRHIVTLITE
ncbi:MAG: zinc ABC transporter substrate-binding protein [Alistipes sp.]|nr:zinc ABC transporter substrate-binding protein [Alistipes sp.]